MRSKFVITLEGNEDYLIVKPAKQLILEMIPKGKSYFKYIKSKNKSSNKELVEILADYFEVGTSEIPNYIDILGKGKIKDILRETGIEEKETKKLLK